MKNAANLLLGFSVLCFTSIASSEVILFEDFEDSILDPRISVTTSGTFNSAPGIHSFSNLDGQFAFGFGRSTNRFNSFENFATNIVIDFDQPTEITSISFMEMEILGNWGSSGRLLADGVLIGDFFGFGKLPYNDGVADTAFRSHQFDINNTVSELVLRVHDSTDLSEIYIDNISIDAQPSVSAPTPSAALLFLSGLVPLVLFQGKKSRKFW